MKDDQITTTSMREVEKSFLFYSGRWVLVKTRVRASQDAAHPEAKSCSDTHVRQYDLNIYAKEGIFCYEQLPAKVTRYLLNWDV